MTGEKKPVPRDLDTDTGALAAGYVTVTPLHYDLTRYDLLEPLKKLEFLHSEAPPAGRTGGS